MGTESLRSLVTGAMKGMGGMTNHTGGMGGGMMMMQMYFTTGGWSDETSLYVLFKWWKSDSIGVYVVTLLATFVLGMMQEFLASVSVEFAHRLRDAYKASSSVSAADAEVKLLSDSVSTDADSQIRARILASVSHMVFVGWHFIAMLAFMTYNAGICIVLLLGIGVGHFVFKTGRVFSKKVDPEKMPGCCSPGGRMSSTGSFLDA